MPAHAEACNNRSALSIKEALQVAVARELKRMFYSGRNADPTGEIVLNPAASMVTDSLTLF